MKMKLVDFLKDCKTVAMIGYNKNNYCYNNHYFLFLNSNKQAIIMGKTHSTIAPQLYSLEEIDEIFAPSIVDVRKTLVYDYNLQELVECEFENVYDLLNHDIEYPRFIIEDYDEKKLIQAIKDLDCTISFKDFTNNSICKPIDLNDFYKATCDINSQTLIKRLRLVLKPRS